MRHGFWIGLTGSSVRGPAAQGPAWHIVAGDAMANVSAAPVLPPSPTVSASDGTAWVG